MNAKQIRNTFFDFFRDKKHKIVSSAPIVNKNDPTLMFTNAGMNQFKDYFLGNQTPPELRLADTQKCLRVSGKHNDLEEVGLDGYHHTMFEMLGNWSIGDYFKDEAISWGWELLTEVFKIDPDRLYATVFSGDPHEKLEKDDESADLWSRYLPKERILFFGKGDNFWEMGDTGPCGPCSEIHIDLRDEKEINTMPGSDLVNKGHPLVIELWNLVFIQYNRKQDSSLEELPQKHVDTGMGFERLCMVIQEKKSNYDTDLFLPFIRFIEKHSGFVYRGRYTPDAKTDIAMRVLADHVRAVCFTIADGALPGNTGAGYVIRRILRRAVRYYYSFLDVKQPFIYQMVPMVANYFDDVFPELKQQESFVTRVIQEEEGSFLKTLEAGLKRFAQFELQGAKVIDGAVAFELYDTYGFPIDLTRLLAREKDLVIDERGFQESMEAQRARSKADAQKEFGDWINLNSGKEDLSFRGYDDLEIADAKVIRYRKVRVKERDQFQLVLDKTPFYPEGGGQVGDTGVISISWNSDPKETETLQVVDTIRENDMIIHIVDRLPALLYDKEKNKRITVSGFVDRERRKLIENNHSATHLLHAALREVLGTHVVQKGSLVDADHLRFDFSHFQKISDEEIAAIEDLVNKKIRENIRRQEDRNIPVEEAKRAGAMMLFGEKYGDEVRMITFDPDYSVELCGGCHVPATGNLGLFKIVSESSIASGVRRIEAITAVRAEKFVNGELAELNRIRSALKSPQNAPDQVETLIEENRQLKKNLEQLQNDRLQTEKRRLLDATEEIGGIHFLSSLIDVPDSKSLKTLAFQLEKELGNAFIVFGAEIQGRPQLLVAISQKLIKQKKLHAGEIIKELAKEIKGGGGGQSFLATAGGKDVNGLTNALKKAKAYLN